MQKIFDQLKAIYNFFVDFWENLIDFFKDIFDAIWQLAKDFFIWIFESILELATSALNAIDFGDFDQYANTLGTLPSDILNVLGLIGFGEAIGIIFVAIGIRFLLQLIPFTRLGS